MDLYSGVHQAQRHSQTCPLGRCCPENGEVPGAAPVASAIHTCGVERSPVPAAGGRPRDAPSEPLDTNVGGSRSGQSATCSSPTDGSQR
eukprot:1914955-Rhodomonas_salina.1